jgi:citrate lyase subunit beta / citryl-CoA lyase
MPPAGFHDQTRPSLMKSALFRSLLFVPGDSARKLDKALGAGADALIIDLEDSVAMAAKTEAREISAAFIDRVAGLSDRPVLFIRINALTTALADADLAMAVRLGVAGIVLPKAVGGADIAQLAARIAPLEAERGMADGQTQIIAIATETAAGVLAMASLAGSNPRLSGIAWGGEDLAADIGAETNRNANGRYTEPFRLARCLTLLAAAAAHVPAIDAVYTSFRDSEGLALECAEARRDGFAAKMAIHPDQVAIINAAFTPSEQSIAWARRVMAAFAESNAGVVSIDGEMIDQPHVTRAQRILGPRQI